MNAQTNKEKFTALHYASYVGNHEICIILIDMGAQIFATNAHGQNVLHIAAQGDQPITLYFFHKIKGMSIMEKDVRGSTPLHWACFKNSEVALIFILAWLQPDQMSVQDMEGNTPLHISVKTCAEIKHCRPTRALLYRGANRDVKDNNGLRPIDIVEELNSITLKKELQSYLETKKGWCDCLMLKTPLRKINKSYSIVFLFVCLNLLVYTPQILFLYPVFFDKNFLYIISAIHLLAIVFWLLSSCMNPGFIKKTEKADFLKLMSYIDPVRICPDCQIVRTPRSRHCGTCNQCVERFDHHCPWINNCVGIKNHRYFILFLIFLTLSLTLNELVAIFTIFQTYSMEKDN